MEAVIGEKGTGMTVEAIGTPEAEARIIFCHEEFETALFLFGEFGFAFGGAVELGVERGEGEEVLLDRDGETFGSDFAISEGFFKEAGVVGDVLEFIDDCGEGFSHFERVFNRMENLVAQTGAAAVPKEGRVFPSKIEERHGVALGFLAEEPGGFGLSVHERIFGRMAGIAGDGGICGESGFEEEVAAEADSFFGERKIGGKIGVGEIARHREGVGGAYLIGGRDFFLLGGLGAWDGSEGEGLRQRFLKVSDEGIAGTRVSSGALRDAKGGFEQAVQMKSELIESVGVDGAIKGESEPVLAVAIVIGEGEVLVGEATLDREKDVTALGRPVEIVVKGIEGVAGWKLVRVSVVDVCGGAEMESQALDAFLGEVGEAQDVRFFAMNVGVPLRGGDASTGGEGEVGLVEEEVESGDIKLFAAGSDQFRRRDGDRFVVPPEIYLQVERPEGGTQDQDCD